MSHEETVLAIIRAWAATAWADGEIADEEAEALRRLIKYSDLPEAEQAKAREWLDESVELETDPLARLSDQRKLFIYRVAVEVAKVDQRLEGPERSLLDQLREALGIPADRAGAVELEVRAKDAGGDEAD